MYNILFTKKPFLNSF